MMPSSKRNQARLEQLQASFLPYKVFDIELSEKIQDVPVFSTETGISYTRGRALVRLHHLPLGTVDFLLGERGLPASAMAALIWKKMGTRINQHLSQDELPQVEGLEDRGLPPRILPLCWSRWNPFLKDLPLVSVIICTHDRTDALKICLESFCSMRYPHYEMIVVDNAPSTSATAELVQHYTCELPSLSYVREDRPGLSNARNAGLRAARGEIIAFTDDDVVVDPFWLEVLLQGFHYSDNVGCVTGLVVPAEIETYAQYLMEQYGGMGKGFERQIFDLKQHRSPNPLIPFSAGWFGVGANMAFKASVLHHLSGFDPAAGTGTPARGGEDLAIFFQVVTRGYQLVYEPGALVHHYHRRGYEGFRKQIYSYGVGLTAYLTKVLLDRPVLLFDLMKRIPSGALYLLSSHSSKNLSKQPDYPKELDWLERLGMLSGPWAYLRSRWHVYQQRNSSQPVRALPIFPPVKKASEQ
jgi:glycosyltransferase involved in cell wall biosynthesis